MAKYNDIQPNKLIYSLANELKNKEEFKAPSWTVFVKTGVNKDRPPINKDWWYIRVAAILRSVAKLGPIGVSKLRTKYGGKHRRGYKPPKFEKGSGSIIRKALQQLEKSKLIQQTNKGVHKGRIITKEGTLLLNSVANKISKEE
ncbi:MAG: 30S ribosomal protein S19e [Candidatus Woesearchaeota archaeon]